MLSNRKLTMRTITQLFPLEVGAESKSILNYKLKEIEEKSPQRKPLEKGKNKGQ